MYLLLEHERRPGVQAKTHQHRSKLRYVPSTLAGETCRRTSQDPPSSDERGGVLMYLPPQLPSTPRLRF